MRQQTNAFELLLTLHCALKVEGLKVNWNVVRDRSTTTEERNRLVQQMLTQVQQHAQDVTLRHDASRMVQCILQFGTDAQKDLVLQDLLPKFHEIAKTPYGHFTVLKAIAYCNQPAAMKKIVNALQKHFVSLSNHVIGARTVESITQLYPPQLTRPLKAELYGKVSCSPPSFHYLSLIFMQNFSILCAEAPKSLHALLAELPTKREAILDRMRDLILQKFVTKSLLEFTYTHHLLWEYIQEIAHLADGSAATSNMEKDKHRMEELVSQLADSAPKLLSTKPGAKAMCMIISCSSAKERKRIIKSLKGHCLESLLHDSAYMGIIRLVDVTDDTVNIQKSFFDELKASAKEIKYTASGEVANTLSAPWLRIACHKNAHKLLLRLLVPNRRCFEPDEGILFNLASESSKKDPVLKRKEHLLYIREAVLRVVNENLEQLLRCKTGSKVVEALVQAFGDRTLNDNIARVYCGLPVASQYDEDAVEEEEMDEAAEEYDQEDEEEAEEENAMDEEEEVEGGADGMDDEDAENAEEDVVDDEDYQEQLKEAEEDRKIAGKSNQDAEVNREAWLPIEEDIAAHSVFKRLMQWEAAVERHQPNNGDHASLQEKVQQAIAAATEDSEAPHRNNQDLTQQLESCDFSLWPAADAVGSSSIARSLLAYLCDPSTPTSYDDRLLLLQWLKCNRATFSLLELFHVPSMLCEHLKPTMEALTEEERSAVDGKGVKLLHQLFNALVQATAKPKAAVQAAGKGKKKTSSKK